MNTHLVAKGETWESLAASAGVPPSWLELANGQDPRGSVPALAEGTTITIPDPPPRVSVAPGNHHNIEAGPGGYAKIRFKGDRQVLSALDTAANKLGTKSIAFEVTLGQAASKTSFFIFDEAGTTIYGEDHTDGELITAGVHTWTWDGYMLGNVLDTAALRKPLLVTVVTHRKSDDQLIEASVPIRGSAHLAKYADVKINRSGRLIEATVYVHIDKAKDDPVILGAGAGAVAGAAVVAGGVAAGVTAGIAAATHNKNAAGLAGMVGGGVAAGVAVAGAVAILAARPAIAVSDDDVKNASALILSGIERFWSRDGSTSGRSIDPHVTIDGDRFDMKTKAQVRDSDSVVFSLMKEVLKGQRPCNLGAVVTGTPILLTMEWLKLGRDRFEETAAHEFGHSVLRDERDKHYSQTHKGSTGDWTHQDALPSQPPYPSAGEIDLMQYWNGYMPSDWADREVVAEDEAKGLISVAQVEFAPR
jgi:hypothetical protein